jgi:isopropylmalate/homocitrate/citramalate synthase
MNKIGLDINHYAPDPSDWTLNSEDSDLSIEPSDLIFDWNSQGDQTARHMVELVDETLRDGLQSPSLTHPRIQEKVYLLYLMNDLGIQSVNVGLPAAGEAIKHDCRVLARETSYPGLSIRPQCAGRTLKRDVQAIVDVVQWAGVEVEACLFIGSSPIRQYVEEWDLDTMLRLSEESIRYALDNGLPVTFVTEDTTRARPETLRRLYTTAIDCGASRICLTDTVGHAKPEGVQNLITFVRGIVDEATAKGDGPVGLDWHGHRDRGLSVANALAAVAAGVDRIHATALGIGERSGNTPMEVLLINLKLMGLIDWDLTLLPEYCSVVAEACDAPLPFNHPVAGADAFRTAVGVHAAGIAKGMDKGDRWLAERVYCSVPASMVGREHTIEIGPLSGMHNVRFWLKSRGIEVPDLVAEKILEAAKDAHRLLRDDEIRHIIFTMERRLSRETASAGA